MRLTILGVRGSTPAPGGQFVRFGGHTSCIAVTAAGASAPTLLLDAGTGLREASALLAGAPFAGSILLTHLHWDHMQGLPFFAAGDRPDARVDLYLPAQDGRDGAALLARPMSPPAFPIGPEGLLGTWAFHAIEAGTFRTAGFAVTAVDIEHKGGRTFGYRIDGDGGSVAYLPDHAPKVAVSDALLDLLAGVDVLIHDAQFLDHERPRAEEYGHATVTDAIALAERVRAERLVLFHHAPGRTDDALDGIAAETAGNARPTVSVAVQGQTIDARG